MDRVTQQNAASAEESSSTAAELSGQASELASLVGGFRLDGARIDRDRVTRATHPAPARAAPPCS
jgi:methyl-accepting chemotaxis protein